MFAPPIYMQTTETLLKTDVFKYGEVDCFENGFISYRCKRLETMLFGFGCV